MNKANDRTRRKRGFKTDYHVYTSASIGTVSFDAIIEMASQASRDVKAICITDRDIVATARFAFGYQRHLQERGEHEALSVIPGMEISTKVTIRERHAP